MPLTSIDAGPARLGHPAATASFLAIWTAIAPTVLASAERDAARLAGDGDVQAFLAWFGGAGIVCLILAIVLARAAAGIWRRQVNAAGPGRDKLELSVAGCMAVSAAIVVGALAVAILASAGLSLGSDLKTTSSEAGPLEWGQSILWLLSAGLALGAAVRLSNADVRGLLVLLGAGALLVAARESDLHEKLNPDTFGAWGVHFRRDWWADANTPIAPRILWAAIALVLLVGGIYFGSRGARAIFARGSRHGRLIWVLAASALLMFLGYALDDLLRYREGINLRQSQVVEETLEISASLIYLATILWAIRLARMSSPPAEKA